MCATRDGFGYSVQQACLFFAGCKAHEQAHSLHEPRSEKTGLRGFDLVPH